MPESWTKEQGAIFGECRSNGQELITLYCTSPKPHFMVMKICRITYFEEWAARFRLEEIRKLHIALGKAIEYMEEAQRDT